MDFMTRFHAAVSVNPPSLQVLFGPTPAAPAAHLQAALRAYHADCATATVEIVDVAAVPGAEAVLAGDGPPAAALGLIAWGEHVVKLAAFAAPMPAAAVNGCLAAALLPPEVKADAKAHTTHVILYYAGTYADSLEQMVAVASVAAVLAEFGAIVTLNEEARAAILATDLLPDDPSEDMHTVLRTAPLLYLYCGFVKIELTEIAGVWTRTFAAPRYGLPNLACHAADHSAGQATFAVFTAVLGYARELQFPFEDGELIRFDEDRIYRLRRPTEEEWWLESDGVLWVLENVSQ
jgi:hypothetical protein